MTLTVVVPTWAGSMSWLPRCLEALGAQTRAVRTILVLDGPAPEAEALARRVLSGARIVRRRERAGFAVAANAGLRAADAPLVGLLNDDATPAPTWAEALLDAAARSPDAGSFASRIVRQDDPATLDSAGHGLCRWGEPFAIGAGAPDGPPYDLERRVFGAPATAALYRRELLRDCGGFDPGMGAYVEDVELSLRAQLRGFPCLYVPSARASHLGSASYGAESTCQVARNRWRLLGRTMPRGILRAALPATLLSSLVEVLRHPEAAPASLEGLRGLREAARERGATLGARRIDDDALRELLRACEEDLIRLCERGSVPRRARGGVARGLRRLVDARERGIARR